MSLIERNRWTAAKNFSKIGFNIFHNDKNIIHLFPILFALDNVNQLSRKKVVTFVFSELSEQLDFTYCLLCFVETVAKDVFNKLNGDLFICA